MRGFLFMSENYYKLRDNSVKERLDKLKKDLPYFCSDFFVGVANKTTPLTRMNYAYDLRIFFYYLSKYAPQIHGRSPKQIGLMDLNLITPKEIENYLDFIGEYEYMGRKYTNSTRAKCRKLATVRTFFDYFYKREKLTHNVTDIIENPTVRDKNIVRLEANEIVDLIDLAETGYALTPTQQIFHKYTRERDSAMISLMLGTGIRVSECVGLDVNDLDFEINGFKVVRKGGDVDILYFSDEVAKSLKSWLTEREKLDLSPTEQALFVSLQNRRISIRAVQNLVKKYSRIVAPLKKISPHKLRSTYGTNLYNETRDIYVVANTLGHRDMNTTKKHYAAMSDETKRQAARKVKLREY